MRHLPRNLLLAALALGLSAPAFADDWFVRLGAAHVDPKSDNGSLAGGVLATTIDSSTQLGLVLGRQLTDNWAVELLAASPFKHTVSLNGVEAVDFKQLPPTLGLQYRFAPSAPVSPFIGAGLNYTRTWSESTRGPVDGADVKLGNSWGLAGQAGLAVRLGDSMELVLEARYIDISVDVSVNGANVGKAHVDPMVYALTLGWRF